MVAASEQAFPLADLPKEARKARARSRSSSSSTATPRSSERDFDFGGLASDDDGSELDADVPWLLDRLNSASDEVNNLEGLAVEAKARYGRRLLRFERLYARMRGEHGVSFDAAKPLFRDASGWAALRDAAGGPAAEVLASCFRALQRHQAGLAREHELIHRLSRRGRAAKDAYAALMRQLEAISEKKHARRRGALSAADVLAA